MKKIFFQELELIVFDSVYAPAEDSFLLAESTKISKGARVLDMGCGTGIQGISAALQGASFVCFADKNPEAVENAKNNFALAGAKACAVFVETDLFSNIKEKFDFIVFNPPYVPTNEKRFFDTDGGKKGREILDGFLLQAKDFLNPHGKLFFLQSSLNGIEATEKLLKKLGFACKIVARKKLFFEELIVFCACRK